MKNPNPDVLRQFAQADLLLLLGQWLGTPPAESFHSDDLFQLAEAADFGAGLTSLVDLAAVRASTPIDDWVAEHNRLFEGGVTCPPNETAYVRRDKGVILADIAGFYRAFGFEPAAETGEKPDHIIAELQFAAMLLVMASRADDDGRFDDESTTRRALASFAADHLGAWIDLFSVRLAEVSRLPCFSELGAAVLSAWRAVCEHHGFEPPENERPADDPSNEGTPYECDLCAPS